MKYATDFIDLFSSNVSPVFVSNATIKVNQNRDTISVRELPEFLGNRQPTTDHGRILAAFIKLCKDNNVLDEAFTKLNMSFIEYKNIKDFVDSKLCASAGNSLFYYKILMDLDVDFSKESNYSLLKKIDKIAGFGYYKKPRS